MNNVIFKSGCGSSGMPFLGNRAWRSTQPDLAVGRADQLPNRVQTAVIW